MQGAVVKTGNLSSYQNQVNIEIYPTGMYFVILKNGYNR
jgi:hypothetical protein